MTRPPETDLAIVGAGILGLAHAWHAARAGMSVAVFERSPAAAGATVRNFGMIATIAQREGPDLDRAERSRAMLAGIAAAAGVPLARSGCLIVAATGEEAAVLADFAAARPGTAWLGPARLAERAPAVRADRLEGGLWAEDVWKIDQRRAATAIARWLEAEHGVAFRFGVEVRAIALPEIATSAGSFRARRAIVCGGDEFAALYPEALAATGVTRCRLQMLRTAPQPDGWRLGPFVLGGLSVARYGAFAGLPGIAALRARLRRDHPRHLHHGIHVIACQEADGSVTIGDSHHYGAGPAEPLPEVDALILDYLGHRLRLAEPRIAERWLGHYAHLDGTDLLRLSPDAGVELVTMTNGQGLTHGLAVAADTVAALC